MEGRSISFFYASKSPIPKYKKSIINYLKESEEAIKQVGEPQIIVELHDFDKRFYPEPNGNIYVSDLGNNPGKFTDVCEYILSKDRKFIPLAVSCKDKKDYGMIEKILKENYYDKGKLTNGLFGIGALFNQKIIKRG